MSHPLVPQLIAMLEEAKEFDFSQTPAVKFIASLRDKLVFTGFSQDDAEVIVSSMEVDLPPGSVEEEDLERLAVLYCEILNKAHQALIDNGFQNPITALLEMAKKFTLKLS